MRARTASVFNVAVARCARATAAEPPIASGARGQFPVALGALESFGERGGERRHRVLDDGPHVGVAMRLRDGRAEQEAATRRVVAGQIEIAGVPVHRAQPVAQRSRPGQCRREDEYLGWMDTPRGRQTFVEFFANYHVPPVAGLAAGLGRIGCPTAIIWGDRDTYIPFSTAHELAERFPDSTLTRLTGADHYVMEERPAEVTVALLDLLKRPAPPPA